MLEEDGKFTTGWGEKSSTRGKFVKMGEKTKIDSIVVYKYLESRCRIEVSKVSCESRYIGWETTFVCGLNGTHFTLRNGRKEGIGGFGTGIH